MAMEKLRALDAALLERDRQVEEEQRQAAELERRAAGERRGIAEAREIVRQIMAEDGMSDAGAGEPQVPPGGGGVDSPGVGGPVYKRGDTMRQMFGPNWQYCTPDRDGESDEPIYSVSVVSGKRNSRERAFAAARVYGPELREMSLAYAIFQTGETRAADAASVRGSLGGLVKYGADWRRERGWLIYQGAGLKPDMVTIFRLTRENDELKRQASQEEVVSN